MSQDQISYAQLRKNVILKYRGFALKQWPSAESGIVHKESSGVLGSIEFQPVEVYGGGSRLPESFRHDFVHITGKASLHGEGTDPRNVPCGTHPSCVLRLV